MKAFEWSLRTGNLLADYNSEEDSAAQPNQEQADAELAANLALDEQAQLNQEQLHTFSQQDRPARSGSSQGVRQVAG